MPDTLSVKIEANGAMEMMGLALAERANKLMEQGRDDKMVRQLHTMGREMVEDARNGDIDVDKHPLASREEDSDPEFRDSLYDV